MVTIIFGQKPTQGSKTAGGGGSTFLLCSLGPNPDEISTFQSKFERSRDWSDVISSVSCPSILCWVTLKHSVSPPLPVSGETPAIFSVSAMTDIPEHLSQDRRERLLLIKLSMICCIMVMLIPLFSFGLVTPHSFAIYEYFLWRHKRHPALGGLSNFRVCC